MSRAAGLRRYALIAGGGTGGHVVPALALARALEAEMGPGSVEIVGSSTGMDSAMIGGSGLASTLLPGRGFRRSAAPSALASNLVACVQLLVAFFMALRLVSGRRPAVVVAVGGYASVPTAVAAGLMGVPVVLVNVDAVPGAANRLVGRFAKVAAVAFEGTPLRRAVVTGVPMREQIETAARAASRARVQARVSLGIPEDRRVVGAVGGSLGARRINEAVVGLAAQWRGRNDVALYHVVGRRDFDWAGSLAAGREADLWYKQVEFEDRMDLFYEAADAVVCRAGANTVAEIAVMGVPSILVPLPSSPGGHQAANAEVLRRVGAAVVLEDAECTPGRLGELLDGMISDDARLGAMKDAALSVGRSDAVSRIVELVRTHALARADGETTRRAGTGRAGTGRAGTGRVGTGGDGS
jgi:UDP-N-acetylglucosamine--N-acetylmuramyl-(pentapeptide) pyrophosphoryl-undecaprenol N-acetylglucosamine transferase